MPLDFKPPYYVGIFEHKNFNDYTNAELIIDKILKPLKQKFDIRIVFLRDTKKSKKRKITTGEIYAKKHNYLYQFVDIQWEKYKGSAIYRAGGEAAKLCHLIIMFGMTMIIKEDETRKDWMSGAVINSGKRHAHIFFIDIRTGQIEHLVPKLPKPIEGGLI